ncbi:hypothetical protein AF71_00058520 [Rhizobium sp. 57MFTsu3.2]|nr:hypothetical protein [Rhizobium sp. 57MFTsu3.2]
MMLRGAVSALINTHIVMPKNILIAQSHLVADDPFLNELVINLGEEEISVRPTNISPFRTTVENTIVPLLPHA